ncbi:MAG: response regulator, partial [Thermoanaerobaculia bacterium]
ARLPVSKRRMLEQLHGAEAVFEGKRVLIVDDDIRNIFALTTVLERQGMQVVHAESGQQGLSLLQASPQVDLVLMDIMMPEMDGYETIRRIRKSRKLDKLPIIALTAKAMKGDREKCLEAGASDYLSKPVEVEQLLSLMRVWLYR